MSNPQTKTNAAAKPAMNPNIVNNIEHVVVMMMENRSFDHILGAFPGVNGIDASAPYYNLQTPSDPQGSGNQPQNQNSVNVISQRRFGAAHTFTPMMTEVFGPTCQGYLTPYGAITGYENGQPVTLKEPCLSGCHPRPQDVGCCHSPE